MKKLRIIFCLLLTMVVLSYAVPVLAASPLNAQDVGIQYGGNTGLGNRDIRDTVASIICTALGLLGIVAVVIVLIGGFKWMTAGGNEEQVGEAKKWLFSGVMGMVIIFSAYALANWVVTSLINATA